MDTVKKIGVSVLMILGVLFLIGGVLLLVKPTYKDDQEFVQHLNEGKVQTGDKVEFTVSDIVRDTILADEVIHASQPNVVYLFENPMFVEYDATYTFPILAKEKVMGIWVVTVDNEPGGEKKHESK